MSKTILITGSTDGIGKLAAIKLAKDGHQVVVHGRNVQKLKALVEEIKNSTQNENITGFVADFSDLSQVKQMAQQVLGQFQQLDVLINNAGVFKSNQSRTQAGFDIRFAVNYFAPYVLTSALLPILEKSEAARIINLSSAAQAPVNLQALKGAQQLDTQSAYAQSKLALTMWSFDLATQLKNTAVIAVNPGSLLNTNMVKEAYGRHWSSADKGGNILYELAIADEYVGVTGKYFDNDKGDPKGHFGQAHPQAYDANAIAALLKATEGLV